MKRSKKIMIPLKGIADGMHDFEFQADDEFYREYPESEVLGGKVDIQVKMDKKPHLIEVFYTFSGSLTVACDKCLEPFHQAVEGNGLLYVKFGKETDNASEELWYVPDSDSEVDLTHFMYESTHLSLPYRRVHPDDELGNPTCDKDMLAQLNAYKTSRDAAAHGHETDPRWEKLKQLRNSN